MEEYIAHYRESDQEIQTVEEHLYSTAKLSNERAEKIHLPKCGELIGLLHDLGKYSLDFQNYINSAIGKLDPDTENYVDTKGRKGKIDHSTAGAQFISKTKNINKTSPYIKQILSLCITSHHGGLIDNIAPDGTDKYSLRIGKEDKKTHFHEVRDKCSSSILQKAEKILESPELFYEVDSLLKSIKEPFSLGMVTRFLLSCLLDADRKDTADFGNPENRQIRLEGQYPDWQDFISALENRLKQFSTDNNVDKIRSEISLNCKKSGFRDQGAFTLTVPTGGGKTLASLRFALEHGNKHKLDRIIYVIPYTSIIDQNAREVRNIFSELSESFSKELVLEHHSNLTSEKETTYQRLMAENWDAPIVFTTSVQLLDTLFKGGTRSARRMHNLANAVLIFDEIQTLPIKTIHLFNRAMNFLVEFCGSSVVLCTATQPHLHLVDKKKGAIERSDESEIISDTSKLFKELKRVDILDKQQPGGLSDNEVARIIQEEMQSTGSVLVIVNTKKSAKKLYGICKGYTKEVYHLSTNQCPQHRLSIIDKLRSLADPASDVPVICISTQLIEAGVDVDFGTVIRYTAGLDSIAQAAGRCNRNGKRSHKGRVLIVNPEKENISSLYDIAKGKEVSLRILNEYQKNPDRFNTDLLSKDAMDLFFKYYFFQRSEEMVYPISNKHNAQDDSLLEMLSGNRNAGNNFVRNQKEALSLPLRQSFATVGKFFNVIDSSTQGVIVPYGEGKEIITDLLASENALEEKELLKSAQRYTVNLYENAITRLFSTGALGMMTKSEVLYLNDEYYSKEYGVSFEELYESYDFDSYCC